MARVEETIRRDPGFAWHWRERFVRWLLLPIRLFLESVAMRIARQVVRDEGGRR
jgi:hypothetical protein